MENTQRLLDEMEALKAVYGEENVIYNESMRRLFVKLDSETQIRVDIPLDYPNITPPIVLGNLIDASEIANLFQPGEDMLLLLIEEIRTRHLDSVARSQKQVEKLTKTSPQKQQQQSSSLLAQPIPVVVDVELDKSRFITGETITANKSRFVAHAARCKTPQEATELLAIIRSSKYARATHNIWAYRLADGRANNDDDGESAAGGRLAELLQLIKVTDILVVVSRYYGGVNVGPQRFKYILQAARDAIDKLLQ